MRQVGQHRSPAPPALPFRLLWLAFLGLVLLVPICVPPSIPWLGGAGLTGWSAAALPGGGTPVFVVTSVMRHAAAAGLMTGDVIVSIQGGVAGPAEVARALDSSRAGDTVTLGTLRRGEARVVRVPVLQNPASLTAFFGFRVATVAGATLVALLILVLRRDTPSTWPLAAALLLVAPTTFHAGLPGDHALNAAVRWIWQSLAAFYRFGFPILLAHFMVLQVPVRPWLRSRRLWLGVYGVALGLFLLATQGLTTPLAWTQEGLARDSRLYSGVVLRLAVLVLALHVRWSATDIPREMRWFADAVAINMLLSVLSGALVLAGISPDQVEMVSRMHAIFFLGIPVTAGLLLTTRMDRPEPLRLRRWAARSISGSLSLLYGLAIAGVAAVVLVSSGGSLDGAEWLLFLAIVLAAVLFSPVLRWSREVVDRRLFSRWIEMENRLTSAIERIGDELEAARIIRRVTSELPGALDLDRAQLVLSIAWSERLGFAGRTGLDDVGATSHPVGPHQAGAHVVLLPVLDRSGETMGHLHLERSSGGDPFGVADMGWQRTLQQGVAAALRNAETFHQLRRAEAEVAQGERIAATGALAAGLAHEIKNPLAGLRIGLHLLRRDGVDQHRLDRILDDLRRIDGMVSTLLRGADGVARDDIIDLREALHEGLRQMEPLAVHRGARLVTRSSDAPALVRGGRDPLRLVISNLLRNAIDAVDDGGRIDARVETVGASVELTVTDDGPGIPDEERERIFDLHHSTKPNGSGLGLAFARREVEYLGGAIDVEVRRDAGTTLRVRLPLVSGGTPGNGGVVLDR